MSLVAHFATKTLKLVLTNVVILVIIGEVLAIFIGTGIYPLWNGYRHIFDIEVGWVYNPNERSFLFKEKITNSIGLNGPEIGNSPVNLLFIGDSVTQMADYENSFTGKLKAVRLGLPGYNTFQLRDLFRRYRYLRPKNIGLIVCANDLLDRDTSETHAKMIDAARKMAELNRFDRMIDYDPLYRLLRLTKFGIRLQANRLQQSHLGRNLAQIATEQQVDPLVWHDWTNAVNQIREMAAPGNFFVVLAPTKIHLEQFQAGKQAKDFWLNRQMAKHFQGTGVSFFDLSQPMSKYDHDEVFRPDDFFHYSDYGHQKVAVELSKLLYANFPLGPRS